MSQCDSLIVMVEFYYLEGWAMENQIEKKRLLSDVQNIFLGNLGTVDADITLPKQGKNGSQFEWKSNNHSIISDAGKVTQPKTGMGNRIVHLKLTAVLGNAVVHKQYTATVVQELRKIPIDHAIDLNVVTHSADYFLPQVAIVQLTDGSYSTAPVTWNDPIDSAKLVQTITGRVPESDSPVKLNLTIDVKNETPIRRQFSDLHVLLEGNDPFATGYQSMIRHLKQVDPEKLVYNFRQAAGLPVDDKNQMLGWDAPDCDLRGHTTGHYMSALALAHFDSQDEIFKQKGDYIVNELAKCQQAFAENGAHAGFLSAYDETQFDELEKFATYPNIWAPYYTLDKILQGLLDVHLYTKNAQALAVATKIGDWVAGRLGKLSHDQLTKMWSIYIAGEFGGMISAMVRLYRATGREKYLSTAKLFSNDKLFVPMAANYDTLDNMHANQHIPQIIGVVDLYEATGDETYLKIAVNFWNMVVQHHTFANGGVGETEMFHEPDEVANYLTDRDEETCASYNMFKLSEQLFELTHDGKYMDYAENILNNHLLVANDHHEDGGTTYFMPLRPGGLKKYDKDSDNTCCHGTGLENMVRFQKNLFAYDGNNLYDNLFYNSRVELPDDGGTISQVVTVNEMTITCELNSSIVFWIRVPQWMDNLRASIDGKTIEMNLQNGYLKLADLDGRKSIRLSFAPKTTVESAPDDSSLVAIFRGPNMLVKKDRRKDFLQTSVETLKKDRELVPFNTVGNEAYHVYFKVR